MRQHWFDNRASLVFPLLGGLTGVICLGCFMAELREQSLHSGALESSFLDRSACSTAQPNELEIIVAKALRTWASGAAIVLQEDGRFVCQASTGPSAPPVGTILEVDSGLSGLCLKTGSLFVCGDAESDPRVNQEACRTFGIRSFVTAPIVCEGQISGLLEVFSRETDAFDHGEVTFLLELAECVVSTIRVREISPRVEFSEKVPAPSILEKAPAVRVEPPKFLIVENSPKRRNALLTALLLAVVVTPVGISLHRRLNPPPAVVEQRDREAALPKGEGQGASTENLSPPEAAQPLNADGAYRLATSLAQGRGVKEDFVEAYAWYVIAAKDGNKASEEAIKTLTSRMPEGSIARVRFRLGQIFELGERVPPNFEMAYFWYRLSADAGDSRASAQKERIGKLLSNNQRQQVDMRVARWLKQHSSPKSQVPAGAPIFP